MSSFQPPGGPTFVRVVSVGRRMQDGWKQVDRGGPIKRFLAGLLVLLLAIPILLFAIIMVLMLLALGLASALVTFAFGGGRRGGRGGPPPGAPNASDRENVRVIPPR